MGTYSIQWKGQLSTYVVMHKALTLNSMGQKSIILDNGPLKHLSFTKYSSTTNLFLGNLTKMLRVSVCPVIQLQA
jgi:hypothetical protein